LGPWTVDLNPFQYYIGRRISRCRRAFIVVSQEVRGRELLFRLRELDTGEEALVTVLELLELENG
jgi:hypothetical protein